MGECKHSLVSGKSLLSLLSFAASCRWILLLPLLVATQTRADGPNKANEPQSNGQSFQVHSFDGGPQTDDVHALCDSLRTNLGRAWTGPQPLAVWQPQCEIRLHQNRSSYVRAVGIAGQQTQGCSLIRLQDGKVTARKIDLLVDSHGDLPALPHELTHVILADCFGGHQPPHWFDEGAAMLADTVHKQSLHARDCQHALRSGTAMPIAQVLRLEQFTSSNQMASFYGQSASLLRFFCGRGDIERVTRFAIDTLDADYEQSLQKHYGIASEQELQRLWKQEAFNQGKTLEPSALLTVRYRP